MSKKISIGIILLLFLGSIGIWIDSWDRPEAAASAKGKLNPEKMGSLFRKIGMIKVPQITESVHFSIMDLNGRVVRISDYRGKIVFLNFWTTWCPSCRIEMPSMEKLHQKLKDKDFAMIAVSLQESAQVVRDFFQEKRLTFTALLDSTGEVGTWFGIRAIPTTYILNGEGKVLGAAMGAREWDSNDALALFEYLADKEVKKAYLVPKESNLERAPHDRG